MEKNEKKRRGRPATGRVRNIKINTFVTADERDKIKEYLQQNGITLADFILKSVENKTT